MVLLSDEDDKHIQQLTSFTCDLGYRCVYVRGGVQALSSSSEEETTEVEALSRDAIFSLMYLYKTSQIRQSREREGGKEKGLQDKDHASTSPKNYVFDVRRHDELTLFGAFPRARTIAWGREGLSKTPVGSVIVVMANAIITIANVVLSAGVEP